jgi:hypothetical protein
MFCSCFVLSLDACIVTITWSLLFVVITLSVIYLTLVCFLVFYWLTRKNLALLTDMVSGFKSLCEAPRFAQKCGTRRSDSLVRAL